MNYIRTKTHAQPTQRLDTPCKEDFASDEYLQPVLEDDAVLFSLEDLDEEPSEDNATKQPTESVTDAPHVTEISQYLTRIAELEQALERSREAFLKDRKGSIDRPAATTRKQDQKDEHDRFYFDSYSTRGESGQPLTLKTEC